MMIMPTMVETPTTATTMPNEWWWRPEKTKHTDGRLGRWVLVVVVGPFSSILLLPMAEGETNNNDDDEEQSTMMT